MRIEVIDGIRGMRYKKQIYDTVEEIKALIQENWNFHDATVFGMSSLPERTVTINVCFDDKGYHFQFSGVTGFYFHDLDFLQNWVSEIVFDEVNGGVYAYFDQVGIHVYAEAAEIIIIERIA